MRARNIVPCRGSECSGIFSGGLARERVGALRLVLRFLESATAGP
jgi:hypothetical protein